jgi:U3 small nucleolar RNA-associated protein 12
MVRSYLKHGPTKVTFPVFSDFFLGKGSYIKFQAFGLVCSSSSNSLFDGKLAYVPALEDVLVWDVKKGQMVNFPANATILMF